MKKERCQIFRRGQLNGISWTKLIAILRNSALVNQGDPIYAFFVTTTKLYRRHRICYQGEVQSTVNNQGSKDPFSESAGQHEGPQHFDTSRT